MVAAGLTVLCAMPVVPSALPATVPAMTASQLRARILASAGQSYTGYAESNATFGLPSLPGLNGVASLLDGVTKMRVWVAAPDQWRVDALSDAGERDTYQLGAVSYIWDSGQELLTEVFGGQRRCGCRARPTWCRRRWPCGCSTRPEARPGSA